jgi:predicted dehydrogenase
MEPVRLAIIGAGSIGARHAQLMHNEPDCQLVAFADPSPVEPELPATFDVPLYASHVEMLQAQEPDGVVVATPNQMHAPVGIDCANAGTHILMEKPISESLEMGLKLVDAVNRNKVQMMVGHHRRFDPAAAAARKLIAGGEIGALQAVTVTWSVRKHDSYYDAEWRRMIGGGPVLINLIHDIDMLRHLCGEIETVYAEQSKAARGLEVEDTAAIILRFKSGALATAMVSDAAPSPWGWEMATGENPLVPASGENCYQFMGTQGSFGFPHIKLWQHGPENNSNWFQPIHATEVEISERSSLARQLSHFCRVIRGDEAPRISGEDGLATLAATEAVSRSFKSGRAVAPEYTL